MTERFQMIIRSPHEVVLDTPLRAVRLPTETGLVGVRPRAERMLLVVEPGLIVLRDDGARRYAATAGGLFRGEGDRCVLYTPFGVTGADANELMEALDRATSTPAGELALRRQLGDLEQRIIGELHARPQRARAGLA